MRSMTLLSSAVLAAAVWFAAGVTAHDEKAAMAAAIHQPDKVKWQDGPPSLPPGAKFAVLEGDPAKPGPFVFRVKVPDGYRIPPHTHPKPERVTIISGTFNLGMGEAFDAKKGEELSAGTYGTWPAGMKHYVWVKGETVVQFHGDGPWVITYVNPADDPRNAKK
ncbi:cupin domain-containing protein [bacterium]|nr:cupin domain-containing protein [bacterium]